MPGMDRLWVFATDVTSSGDGAGVVAQRPRIIAHRSPQPFKTPQVDRSVGRFTRGGFQPTHGAMRIDDRPFPAASWIIDRTIPAASWIIDRPIPAAWWIIDRALSPAAEAIASAAPYTA
jgi:hypothetical protein